MASRNGPKSWIWPRLHEYRRPDRVHRPHAPEDHRRVEEGVEPGKLLQKMVAGDADPERLEDDGQGDDEMAEEAAGEPPPGQERLALVLIYSVDFVSRMRRGSAAIRAHQVMDTDQDDIPEGREQGGEQPNLASRVVGPGHRRLLDREAELLRQKTQLRIERPALDH